MPVFSSLKSIETTCQGYLHPHDPSCSNYLLYLTIDAAAESLRIYTMAYSLAILMKRKVPSKRDLKRTFLGILQSSLFLTTNATAFGFFVCFMRKLLGSYNYLTVGFAPSFLASFVAISFERTSRRGLLCLYVTNVASETLFRMAVSRNLVKPIRFGEILLFSLSIAQLLYFFRSRHVENDPIYGFLRLLVGRSEERSSEGESRRLEYIGEELPREIRCKDGSAAMQAYIRLVNLANRRYYAFKHSPPHPACPHPNHCLHYTLEKSAHLFLLGYGIQFGLKIFLQLRRLIRRPSTLKNIIFSFDTMRLGALFASFSVLYRGASCSLRRWLGKDDKRIAYPAGVLAGVSFLFYRDNTIALYFMWKAFNEAYRRCVEKGYLVDVPYSTELLYACSTAVLFHTAVLEPINLRPSYWRFLHGISGGRLLTLDRKPLDALGFDSLAHFKKVMSQKKK